VANEIDAWRDLVQSPGWALLVVHAQEEWSGPAFAGMVEKLVDKPDDVEALNKLRQAIAAKRSVERLLNVPKEAIARLTRQAEPAGDGLSRRGAL
jgi:hypothetical protein